MGELKSLLLSKMTKLRKDGSESQQQEINDLKNAQGNLLTKVEKVNKILDSKS